MTTPPPSSLATVIGAGEIGRWVAGAMLYQGVTVQPVLRHQSIAERLAGHSPGSPILIAVPEASLGAVLDATPTSAAADVLLVQNGTFPSDLPPAFAASAGWCVVWTLRRRGEAPVTGQPTAISGRHAEWLSQAMRDIGEPARVLADPSAVRRELACKFAFILSINGVGLTHDGSLGDALAARGDELREALHECLAVTLNMASTPETDTEALVDHAMTAMRNMHGMRIRSGAARARLQRALQFARANALPHPWLQRVAV